MLVAAAITILVGVPFGVLSAVHQYGRVDYALSGFTIFLVSTPTVPARRSCALYLFGVTLKVLPVGELFTFGKEDDLVDRAAHIVMPAMILGLANAALLMRYTRASMLDVLNSDYITTARAKGLAGRIVLVRHGLRNALIPIITVLAILLPELIAGAVITETVFNWPGLGQLSVRAARDRDPGADDGRRAHRGHLHGHRQHRRGLRLLRRRPEDPVCPRSLSGARRARSSPASTRACGGRPSGGSCATASRSSGSSILTTIVGDRGLPAAARPARSAQDRLRRHPPAARARATSSVPTCPAATSSPGSSTARGSRSSSGSARWRSTSSSGPSLGMIAGFSGGLRDQVIMRFTDVLLGDPADPPVHRVHLDRRARASPRSSRSSACWAGRTRPASSAASCCRCASPSSSPRAASSATSSREIARRHLLPNILGPLTVVATFGVAQAILLEASLSFLGLGVRPPVPSLGEMINAATAPSTLQDMPWVWLPPGIVIALLVLSVNFIGDGVRDALDPRSTRRG